MHRFQELRLLLTLPIRRVARDEMKARTCVISSSFSRSTELLSWKRLAACVFATADRSGNFFLQLIGRFDHKRCIGEGNRVPDAAMEHKEAIGPLHTFVVDIFSGEVPREHFEEIASFGDGIAVDGSA